MAAAMEALAEAAVEAAAVAAAMAVEICLAVEQTSHRPERAGATHGAEAVVRALGGWRRDALLLACRVVPSGFARLGP